MSQRTVHSPTLATIKMVEETLKNAPDTYTTMAQLKRLLPRQVNHNTLKEIISYLQEENKITLGVEGILWIHNDSPKFKKFAARAIPYDRILSEKEREALLKD